MVETLSQQEQPITPEKGPEEIYREALEQKRDTLIAFHAMNLFRKGKVPVEMSPEETERYKNLRDQWQDKKTVSLNSWKSLPEDKQDELAAMGTNLNVVEANLALLGPQSQQEATGVGLPTTTETGVPSVSTQESQPVQAIENRPESGLTLTDVESRIQRLQNSTPTPLLELEFWKLKKLELEQRQDAQANPDRTPPKGFMARVKDAFDRARGVGPLEQSRMSPLGLKEYPQVTVPEETPIQEGTSAQPETAPTPAEKEPKKLSIWSWKFWKERGKGFLTFGIYDIHQGEKFRTKTGEVAGEVKNLATLLQQERNLSLEEAQTEAQEMVRVLNEQGITNISASEYQSVSSEITERKRKENDEEVAYIVQTAENAVYDNLQKQKGEAGQEILTRENQLAIRSNLTEELNKLRDGASRNDFKNFAKVVRRNLDENWKWRYVWGGLEALAGLVGTWFLVTKFSVIEAAKAAAGSPEAAKEFVTKTMDQNVWHTLKEMAQSGPNHFTPTSEQLIEWSKEVAKINHWYEPEWFKGVIDGLRSTRTLPQGIPMQVPLLIARAMGY